MRFSIVIATHNRQASLRRCLTAVTQQTYPAYEVIVVDDASTDHTAAMIHDEFPQVHYFRQTTNRGPAAARNRGIRQASGDIIAFTDDDCVPPKTWLQQHADYYTAADIGAVGGHQVPQNPNFYDKFEMAHYAPEYRQVRIIEKISYHGGLYTNNLTAPKPIFEQVGLFDEAFLTGADPELTRRISRAGYRLIHDPELRVEHLKVHSFRSYQKMRFRRGCGSILTDIKENSLSMRRFVPIINPFRTWQDWSHFQKMFSGNVRDWVAFWSLAIISRLVEVTGRIYYYMTVGRDYQKS